MNYYKITCMNGYAGCDEDYYIEAESEGIAEDIGNDIFWNNYSFIEPDERFIDDYDDEEAIEEYQENCCFWIDPLSKEEYLEAKEWGY